MTILVMPTSRHKPMEWPGLTTRALLYVWRNRLFMDSPENYLTRNYTQDEFETVSTDLKSLCSTMRALLATREHVPDKAEMKALRQAAQGRKEKKTLKYRR